MSQAGSTGGGSGPLPPTVATQYTCDAGIATPAANNLDVFGNYVTANNTNGIETLGSGDTLTVQLTNRSQGSGSTVGAVTDDLASFTMPVTAAAAMLQGWVVGLNAATGDGFSCLIRGGAKTDGATAAIIGVPVSDIVADAALAGALVDFTATGNNVRIIVTGVAAITMQWQAVLYNTITAV